MTEQPPRDDFDPVIAERFRLLDRVDAPDASAVATVTQSRHQPRPQPERPGRRSPFLVAVAACVGLLVVGAGAILALNRSSQTNLIEGADETVDGAEIPVVTSDRTTTTAALVIDGDSVVSTSRSSDTGDADGAESGSDESTTDGTPVDDTGSESSSPTAVGDVGGAMPADDGDRTAVTTPTESDRDVNGGDGELTTTVYREKNPTETNDSDPGDKAPETVTLQGMVTEVFTDCVGHLVLNEAGDVVDGGPVTCDGGSYIVVDRIRVFTSSGFTTADKAYDKHPSELRPGRQVSVTAAPIGGTIGRLGLACSTCEVRVL